MTGPNLGKLAWRNLWRNRRRTILTLASIAFGAFLAVLMTAMQDRSFSDMIDTAAKLGAGHVTFQHPDYRDLPSLKRSIDGSPALIQHALSNDLVISAVPRITGNAMLATASDSFGAMIVAYDPTLEDDTTMPYMEALSEGTLFTSREDKGVVLGTKLAANLGLELGGKVVYTLMGKDGEISAGLGRLKGILKTGTPSVDAALCLMPIGALQKAIGYGPDESTQIAIFIEDSRKSGAVASSLSPSLPPNTVALPWDAVQPDLAGFIAMKVGGARFMELIVMLLVAAGIFNTLFVSVMERMREFGIMMAIGYSPGQLFTLVMLECLWLALVGLFVATLLTYPLYSYLAANGIDLSAAMAGQATEVAGVGFDPLLKVGIFPENVALIGLFVLGTTLAAGIYPAWRAGHVDPIKSIKLA